MNTRSAPGDGDYNGAGCEAKANAIMTSAIVTASLVQAVVNMAACLTYIGQYRRVAAPVELAKCVDLELCQSYLRLAKRISKARNSTLVRLRSDDGNSSPRRLCCRIVPDRQRE